MSRADGYVGIATERRGYDLPLQRDEGSRFLILLIGLMVYLATMTLSANFVVSALSERWTQGLEGQVTVEIPVRGKDDRPRALSTGERIVQLARQTPGVLSANLVDDAQIADLVSPWLGEGLSLDVLPLPVLISIDYDTDNGIDLKAMERMFQRYQSDARIDDHGMWMADILSLTSALAFVAILLTLIIAFTTVTAVAGGTKSRMAIHRKAVELLHLMGASDNYIAKQFQKHSMVMALKGSALGVVLAALSMMGIGWMAGAMEVNLLPDFRLEVHHWLFIACIPVLSALIAMLTARRTVLAELSEMP